jgi:hypothetical protein
MLEEHPSQRDLKKSGAGGRSMVEKVRAPPPSHVDSRGRKGRDEEVVKS